MLKRERNRALAYLDRFQKARERGHRVLLEHAEAIIYEKTTGKVAKVYCDDNAFESAVKDSRAVAEDLDNLAHVLRPFIKAEHRPHEWARFGETRHYLDGQRKVIRDRPTWTAEVIKPMKKHHAGIIAEMEALRRRLRRAAPKGEEGAPRKYPKTLELAVKLRRKGKRWKEVWAECQRKSRQVGETLPDMKSFIRRVQDYNATHPE
jgi:hypothetical protein